MGSKEPKKNMGATTEFKIKRKRKKGLALWQKIVIAAVAVLCAIVLFSLVVFAYYKYIHKPVVPKGNDDAVPGMIESTSLGNKQKYSFLLVGCDKRQWLSDVIMVATYDVKNKSIAFMQVPRDTYVTVSDKLLLDENGKITSENFDGKNDYGCKINSVLGHGGNIAGAELARIAKLASSSDDLDTICKESFLDIDSKALKSYLSATGDAKSKMEYQTKLKFGIKYLSSLLARYFATPIDFYAQVNVDGFVNIVDAIGGVDVYVQQDMDYDDPYQDLHIHLKQGQQHLDGVNAEGFVRFRHGYATADIARIDAQKIFMTAFIKKVLSLEGIMNLKDLVNEIQSNLTTNVTIDDALYFATNALDIDLSKVIMLTMPGSSVYKNNVSYYSVNKAAMMEYVNTYLNKYSTPISEEAFYAIEISSKNPYNTPPMTAEDINANQPDLGFLGGNGSGYGSSNKQTSGGSASSMPPVSEAQPTPDPHLDPDPDPDTSAETKNEAEEAPSAKADVETTLENNATAPVNENKENTDNNANISVSDDTEAPMIFKNETGSDSTNTETKDSEQN